MISKLSLAAALALALAGPATAVTVLVDDFENEDQFAMDVVDPNPYANAPYFYTGTPAESGALPNGLKRTITHALTLGDRTTQEYSWATVGPNNDKGHYSVSNDTLLNSTGTVSWNLGAAFIGMSSAGTAAVTMDVVGTDLDVSADLWVGATKVGSVIFTGAGTVAFALPSDVQDGLSTSGGMLKLEFKGPEAYDATIDNVRFEITPIPEASTAAMTLAGLAVLIGWRRRSLRLQQAV